MPIKDLLHKKFGRLFVLEYSHSQGGSYWKCKCDCGNQVVVRGSHLGQNAIQSCGCLQMDNRRKRRKNIAGNKYGKLLVLEPAFPDGVRRTYWKCKCDCGNYCIIQTSELLSAHTKSCGCMRKDAGANKRIPAVVRLMNIYRREGEKRGYSFELNLSQFISIIQENCFYCGEVPKNILKRNIQIILVYNGLDRVDNSKGYYSENVVPCCGRCNRMKMADNQKDFFQHIKRIHEHQGKRLTQHALDAATAARLPSSFSAEVINPAMGQGATRRAQ
jgi:hypothetical protein